MIMADELPQEINMKKILATLSVSCFALGLMTACGPDNVGACTEAETALNDAAEECDLDANYDLSCESLDGSSADCTAYYSEVTDTATCADDGTVDFEYGDACA